MKHYRAIATRDNRYWFIEVPELEQATQARTAAEAQEMVRDLVAVMLEVAPDSFTVSIEWNLPKDITAHLRSAEQLREEAARANAAAAAEVRIAARELQQAGLGLRDIGKVMGVSYQRAGQLVGRRFVPEG